MKNSFYESESQASVLQHEARNKILDIFTQNYIPDDDKIVNLGLFIRSSLLAKIITLQEIYKRIQEIPGVLMEFGSWYGQNLILLENLRAIYEPFNKERKIVGFDTYEGYKGFSKIDKESEVFSENSYTLKEDYKEVLSSLLHYHTQSNILGHIDNPHELIKGSVVETVPQYFMNHPETIVAFGYFDMGLYEPTKIALQTIKPYLIPGSILWFDELTWAKAPGECIAFKEVFRDAKYKIEKCPLFPAKTIITIRE